MITPLTSLVTQALHWVQGWPFRAVLNISIHWGISSFSGSFCCDVGPAMNTSLAQCYQIYYCYLFLCMLAKLKKPNKLETLKCLGTLCLKYLKKRSVGLQTAGLGALDNVLWLSSEQIYLMQVDYTAHSYVTTLLQRDQQATQAPGHYRPYLFNSYPLGTGPLRSLYICH